jgi:hypothetical protein
MGLITKISEYYLPSLNIFWYILYKVINTCKKLCGRFLTYVYKRKIFSNYWLT